MKVARLAATAALLLLVAACSSDDIVGPSADDALRLDARKKLPKSDTSATEPPPPSSSTNPFAGATFYVDAGHPRWQSVSETANRLTSVGISLADGFSLNVSNFITTSDNVGYGKQISALIGGKHFVIDTARNGLGPTADYQWCNPPDRALGSGSTAATVDPAVDAYLWIKPPGESDGTCNGGPSAGAWWADYALALAQRG